MVVQHTEMDYLSNIFPDQDEPCYERSQSTTQSDLNASVHPTADTDSSGAMGTDSVVASWPNSETNLYLPLSTYTDEVFRGRNDQRSRWSSNECNNIAEMSSEVAGNRCAGPSSTSLQDFTQDSSLSDLLEHSREPNADLLSFGLQELDASTNNNLLHVLPNISLSELQENLRSYEVFDAQHQKRPGIGTMEDDLPSQIQAIQGYGSLDVMGPQASANDLFPHDSIPVDMDWVMDDSFSCFHHTPSNMDVLRSNKPNLPMSIFESPGSAHPSPDRASDGGVSRHYGPEGALLSEHGLFCGQTSSNFMETSMNYTDRRHTATGDNIVQNVISNTFQGPCRPVSLLPRRNGGRKGPLSIEHKERSKEARNHGVCIRCRIYRKGCSGGFPCVLCHAKSKAPRWKYPCIRADFFDLVENGTYFSTIFTTEYEITHSIDRKIIERQFSSILRIAKEEQSGKFTLCVPGLMGIEGIINWYVILWILAEIIRECNHDKKGSLSSHQLYKVVRCLKKANPRHIPIMFSYPPTSGSWYEWTLSPLILCGSTHRGIYRINSTSGLDERVSRVDHRCWEILIWLSRRHFELCLFQKLQNFANNMTSRVRKEISSEEKSNIADTFLKCVVLGRSTQESFEMSRMRMNGESRPEIAIAAFTERRNRIRSALHCYLQMAVSQLPAFSDFWKVRSDCLLPMPSDTWKVVLDDISILDSQISDSVSTAMSYMECYKDWYNSPNMGIVPSLGDLALKDVDTTEAVRLAQEILTGSVFQATIKETLTILSGRIEVAFLAARDAFETLGLSSIVGTCQDTIIELERIQVDLRHCLAELEKNPRNLDQIKRSGDSVRIADQNMETWVDELRSYMEILKGVTEREDLGHDSD